MSIDANIEAILKGHRSVLDEFEKSCLPALEGSAKAMINTLDQGNTIFICGNGGSAADSQHFAAELVGLFQDRKRRALPSIALTTDTSALTSIGNDLGFRDIFSRQIEGLGRPGDLLVGISTSGRSENVLAAMETSYRVGMTCVGLCGADGSAMAPYSTQVVAVPSQVTARTQEMHIMVIHSWCELIDKHFSSN